MKNTVEFYNESFPNFWLSNFYCSNLTIRGKKWKSVEHYYQSEKFVDSRISELIRSASSPKIAKEIAYEYIENTRPDWNSMKVETMRDALKEKFRSPELATLLLDTGDSILVERSPSDSFWGCVDGKGENTLGLLLMEIRSSLR
jgi:ribA/ribD-fused uncharacterized protein